MDTLHQPLNITEYNNLITNIIESAVDELIQKRVECGSTGVVPLGYDDATGVPEPFPLLVCRLCAREDPLLLDVSELHLVLIAELAISGIDSSVGCTKICSTCADFLGRIREFRCKCEEAQKRISSLLAERSVISEFLSLDFGSSKPEDEQYGGFSVPPVALSVPVVPPIVVPLEPPDSSVPELPDIDDFAEQESSESEESVEEEVSKEPSRPVALGQLPKKPKVASDSRRRVVNGKLQWVCLDCEQIFQSCAKLKNHRRTCEYVGNKNSKRVGPFTCEICGRSVPTLAGLRVHVRKHSKSTAPDAASKKPKSKDKSAADSKPIVCHVCGKQFGGMNYLRTHLLFHDQDKRIECQICNKKFYKLHQLKDHLNGHSNVRRFGCQVCGKAFFTRSQLYKHSRSHDQNSRKHQCTMCPMRFAQPYLLRGHMMIHTAEYPHGCKICQSKFRFLWDLKRHYAKVHPPQPEEPEPLPVQEQLQQQEPPPPLPTEDLDHHHLPMDEVLPPTLLHPQQQQPSSLIGSLPPLPDPSVVSLMEEDHHHHHDDLSVMLADIPPHDAQPPELTPSVAAVQPVLAEHPFDAETLLEEASREFSTDCFPDPDHLGSQHTGAPDDDFYTFMEC